jgi:phosphopantothenoylcysteine decarboxylase/phosphopantothenate--cysteine ligase
MPNPAAAAAPTPLDGRRVLLGVCGGIAAFRACDLARELMRRGAEVQCVLTPRAAEFVTPLTFEGLTGHPALVSEYPAVGASPAGDVYAHLNLTRGIDAFVIAPLSANTLADLAAGRAHNLLTACYLSCTAPVLLAPAMNTRMLLNAAVQDNLALVARRGNSIMQPGSGALACGDEGSGRLAEVADIAAAVEAVLGPNPDRIAHADGALAGRRFIVTGGGTREYLDPVRFITNASTGTLALAVAEALLDAGAAVELIAGEVHVPPALAGRLAGQETVRTAFDLQSAIAAALPQADGLVMLAAVADYTPAQYSSVKRKKDGQSWRVELAETGDVLKSLAGLRRPGQVFVAVSLEDEDWQARAVKKAASKGVQLMLGVELGADLPFGDQRLHCALFADGAAVLPPARRSKQEAAAAISAWLGTHFAPLAEPVPPGI